MKYIANTLTVIISIFWTQSAFGQTILAPLPLTSYSRHSDSIDFNDTTVYVAKQAMPFVLGWQWSGPSYQTNKRLKCNMYHHLFGYTDRQIYYKAIPDSVRSYIISAGVHRYGESVNDPYFFGGRGIHFDPTADPNYSSSTLSRLGDSTGDVFGFRFRSKARLSDVGNPNYDRVIFSPDSIAGGSSVDGEVVLDTVVVNDQFTVLRKDDVAFKNGFNGHTWLLSINLRRMGSLDTSTTINDTLLSIILPYAMNSEYNVFDNYLLYDSVSTGSFTTAVNLPENRGKLLPMSKSTSGQNAFVVTRQMLPPGSASGLNRDITLKARIAFTSSAGIEVNPVLVGAPHFGVGYVSQFTIRVLYHGRDSVAVDWLRIATPDCNDVVCGVKDSSIWEYVYGAQEALRDSISAGHNIRMYAFYGQDEPKTIDLLASRYFSKLMPHMYIMEGLADKQRQQYVNQRVPWAGSTNLIYHHFTPSAILGRGNGSPSSSFSMKYGWKEVLYQAGRTLQADGSNYDTDLAMDATFAGEYSGYPYWVRLLRQESSHQNHSTKYTKLTSGSGNPDNVNQMGPVHVLEAGLINLIHRVQLYDTLRWWSNIWGNMPLITSWSPTSSARQVYSDYDRFLSGEEMRAQINFALIYGAKGLMYDRMYTDTVVSTTVGSVACDTCPPYPRESAHIIGMMHDSTQISPSLTGTALIESDDAGSDFLAQNDRAHIDIFYPLTQMASDREDEPGRVYVGRKSMRREIMKTHDFIRLNESILMRSSLFASFGKGMYKILTGDSAALSRIIDPALIFHVDSDTTTVVSRPVNRVATSGGSSVPHYEPYDSTFCDITLHKLANVPIDSEFVLCVFNRRTNPLLKLDSTLAFKSTAEFDAGVALGTYSKYAQGGSREIKIPFRFTKGIDPHTDKYVLQVRELGGGDTTIARVDTLLCPNCPLTSLYLPGEAKFFHVTVLPTGRTIGKGALEFTNQHKVVCVPEIDSFVSNVPVYSKDRVRYHLVYHRQDTIIHDTAHFAVYYRRSISLNRCNPIDVVDPMTFPTGAIWENEIKLSSEVKRFPPTRPGDTTVYENPSAKYPSIVVRYNPVDSAEYVYVAFNYLHPSTTSLAGLVGIAESQFANNSIVPSTYHVRDLGEGSAMDVNGHPVINAAKGLNFYAFSDANSGICVGTRPLGKMLRDSFDYQYLSWFPHDGTWLCADSRHPSLNNYSNLDNDSTCALTWQERKMCSDTIPYDSAYDAWQVYYTNLKYEAGHIQHYLPHLDTTGGYNWAFKTGDNGIVRPKYCGSTGCNGDWRDRQMPIVLRAYHNNDSGRFNFDKLLCHAARAFPCFGTGTITGILYFSMLSHQDCPSCPVEFQPMGNNCTYSCSDSIRYVSGTVAMKFDSRKGDSTYVYNMELPEYDHSVLQVVQSYFKFGGPGNTYIDNVESPQLTAFPRINGDDMWSFTRRIANKPDTIVNRDMNTSVKYLMKGVTGGLRKTYVLRGFQHDQRSFMLCDVIDPEQSSTLQDSSWQFDRRSPVDTLKSAWFRISDARRIHFVGTGSAYELIVLKVENRRTGATVEIDPRSVIQSNSVMPEAGKLDLANGGDDYYRLIMFSTDPAAKESEDIFIGSIGSAYGKSAIDDDKEGVDLSPTWSTDENSGVTVSPNPAEDVVYIGVGKRTRETVSSNEMIVVTVVNQLGRVLFSTRSNGSETITFDTSSLPSGMYAVQVAQPSSGAQLGLRNVVRKFVISR